MNYSVDEWLLYLQNLNTCADCAKIILVQFHHFNDREGRGACVSVVLKFYWSKFDPVKMVISKHGGVAYMQLSCIDG